MNKPAAVVFPDNPAALALCRELGAAGIGVTVLDARGNGPAAFSRFATLVRTPDLYHEPAAWLDRACQWAESCAEPPVLFPTEDAALLIAERHHPRLSEHFRYPYAAPGVADKIIDKRLLYDAAGSVGIDVPETREIHSEAEAAELPAQGWLVKPSCRYRFDGERIVTFLSTSGGSKALGGDAREAARRVLQAGFSTIAQEQIPGGFGELISVGLCMAPDGQVLDSFTSRKDCEYPEPYGDGLIVELADDPGVLAQAVAVLHALGYWGVCDVEFKRDPRDGRLKLLDANPRGWLWMGLGTMSGHSLAVAAYEVATGVPAATRVVANPAFRRWVSARGTAAFLARCYRRQRHGWALPWKLVTGAIATGLAGLHAFGDPLYLRADAWRGLARALGRSRSRVNPPIEEKAGA